jgi:hypothetical protein
MTRVVVLDPMVVRRLRDVVGRTLDGGWPVDRVDPLDAAMVALAAGGLQTAVDRRAARANKSRIAELELMAGPRSRRSARSSGASSSGRVGGRVAAVKATRS